MNCKFDFEGLPDLPLSHKLASSTSCLNSPTGSLTVLTSTHLSPYAACIRRRISSGGVFSTFRTQQLHAD